jgi:xanthine dehydrogenase accessory factor
MKNIYLQYLDLYKADQNIALSTITRSIGSTPQKPGCSAIIGKSGLVSGTVGGGILEAKVIEISQKAIISKDSCHPTICLNKDISGGEDAICGGEVSVLIDSDPLKHLSVFTELKESINLKIPGVLITLVDYFSGSRVLINRYWMTESDQPYMPPHINPKVRRELKNSLSKAETHDFREFEIKTTNEESSFRILLEPVFPQPSLIIAGAGHIGKVLAHLGYMLDFEVTVIDDRAEFANKSNFPDATHILTGDIGPTLRKLEKKSDTYIVIVTRGHRDDADALKACIESDVPYIGMIGSKNKVSVMHSDFLSNGWATGEQWNRIHAPVGLEIKSKTVEEIAVSIAAQLVLVKNAKN